MEQFPVDDTTNNTDVQPNVLSFEEKNVLRYIAGYVLKAVNKKLKASAHTPSMKRELELCIVELLEDEETLIIGDESSNWINLKDRGGLKHVTSNMFIFLSSVEHVIKSYIGSQKRPEDFNIDGVLTQKVQSDEQVQMYWELISTNWGEEEGRVLLSAIIDHYITVRGFAHTSAWMEKYKTSNQKNVQKTKGIRKTLLPSDSSATTP